jgi:hypothetical protein
MRKKENAGRRPTHTFPVLHSVCLGRHGASPIFSWLRFSGREHIIKPTIR